MIVQDLLFIFNNFFILILYEKVFNLKLSKIQFNILYINLTLIYISLFYQAIFISTFLFLLTAKVLKLNINSISITLISISTIYLLTFYISNLLSIPNIFCTIILIILNLIILKTNFKINLYHLSKTSILNIFILFTLYIKPYNLPNIILIISLFIYTLKLTIDNSKQTLELENLTLICDSTRAFKHDFNNIMHSIGGYIKTNNLIDLKKYYDKLMPECFCINNLHIFHSSLMQNPAIYSIISNKYNLAQKNNVKMTLNISTNLNTLRIDDYSLTRILGILLDNSIEASRDCSSKLINISFKENKDKQSITIENTFNNKHIPLRKLYEKEFSTKVNNTGLGLWEVKKILNNHQNISLETDIDDNFFIQELEIF